MNLSRFRTNLQKANVFDTINDITKGNLNTLNNFSFKQDVRDKLESIETVCRLTTDNAHERFEQIYDICPNRLMDLLKEE